MSFAGPFVRFLKIFVCLFLLIISNPTSGFIIIVPRTDVIELDMEVDEALKMIISLGVVVPIWSEEQAAELPRRMPTPESLETD